MKKACVLLSGCGNKDGSEVREAVLSLLSLDLHQVAPICLAPRIEQKETINHWESKKEEHARVSIVEAARIARGDILPIEDSFDSEADFLVIPGGLGAITTLCSFKEDGPSATVYPPVQKCITTFYEQKKPIVAICIAPVIVALALQKYKPIDLTLGKQPSDLELLKTLGMNPISCDVDHFVVDTTHKIISTPAYMGTPSLGRIWEGISGAIDAACTSETWQK